MNESIIQNRVLKDNMKTIQVLLQLNCHLNGHTEMIGWSNLGSTKS